VRTVQQIGLSGLANGKLLAAASADFVGKLFAFGARAVADTRWFHTQYVYGVA
jgi:hypothetical protein